MAALYTRQVTSAMPGHGLIAGETVFASIAAKGPSCLAVTGADVKPDAPARPHKA